MVMFSQSALADENSHPINNDSQSGQDTGDERRDGLRDRRRENIIKPISPVDHINITTFPIDPEAVKAVPPKVVLHYKFMPLELSNGVLKIAVNSLNNVTLFDELRIFLGLEVIPFLAREEDIIKGINQYYGIGAESIEGIIEHVFDAQEYADNRVPVDEITKNEDNEASIIKFVNKLFFDAYEARATDIHIEPYIDKLQIRYRVDGSLVKLNIAQDIVHLKDSIISRIKIMANLDIAERRIPQDGRIKVKIHDRLLDLRLSTLPTAYGESIDIRLLSSHIELDLHHLGFNKEYARLIDTIMKKPHGMVLVTGPTGSGKTSTLYTCLSQLNRDNRKIITIEDPVEYYLEGITQMQTKQKIGFDFAAGLRSILRHDPDIIMVGEIRDRETAEIAFKSALTGHLVFSTLHTNRASNVITRLMDMGLEPYVIADALDCVISQRLVRVLCEHCKVQKVLHAREKEPDQLYYSDLEHGKDGYEADGCPYCIKTGYLGRTVLSEILIIDNDIKKLIHNRASADTIHEKAIHKGMKTLWQSGLEKVQEGITTIDEVIKVTA